MPKLFSGRPLVPVASVLPPSWRKGIGESVTVRCRPCTYLAKIASTRSWRGWRSKTNLANLAHRVTHWPQSGYETCVYILFSSTSPPAPGFGGQWRQFVFSLSPWERAGLRAFINAARSVTNAHNGRAYILHRPACNLCKCSITLPPCPLCFC